MEEIINLIATDGSPSDISDKMKEILLSKSANRIDALEAEIGNMMFNPETEETPEEESE